MPAEEKTEQPTAKKRRDERKKGNVLMSRDVPLIVGLAGCFVVLRYYIATMSVGLQSYMTQALEQSALLDAGSLGLMTAVEFCLAFLKCVYPLFIAAVLLGILSVCVQTRFLFAKEKIKPKLRNLNPINGIKRIFSIKNLIELLKSVLKIIVLVWVFYGIMKSDFAEIRKTMDMSLKVSITFVLSMIYNMIWKIVMVFVIIAFFDFLYQRWDFERNMKMTKQEVKEEFKQTEGNPEVKNRIRSIMRQRAMSRMMQAVPQADVVIRNPTHFAVALKYDIKKDVAPYVVAKGQDEVALRIVDIAEKSGVYVIENKPLARALYAACKLNERIPEEYYGAVAEILVYVFRMTNKWSDAVND